MNPVRALKNQYRGINAHLHSSLPLPGSWAGFLTRHIGDMAGLLRAQLYPMGYTAEIEESLQVRRSGDFLRTPRADILIVDEGTAAGETRYPRQSSGDAQDVVVAIPEALGVIEEVDYYRAVAIYPTRPAKGEPVAWIELLSPSNKPGGRDWSEYQHKRQRLLYGHLVFVEIDYLHESPPTLAIVPRYPAVSAQTNGAEAQPYRILVFDPRPVIDEGQVRVRSFRVDDPVPTMNIPLLDDDVLAFDFGAAYDKTFSEMLYGNEVDYAELPANFDRYDQTDQARILNRMLAVIKAAEQGVDLENAAPLPVDDLSLDEARARYSTISNA
jgi:hypothetical protein